MSTVICDSNGWPVTKGHDYKIRLEGGSELGLYAGTFSDELRITAGPPGSGTLFYIDNDSWTSGTTCDMYAKAWTYNDFKTKTSGLYTTFKKYTEGNWGFSLTQNWSDRKSLYAVAGCDNCAFLGTNAKNGLRVSPHWKAETGWHYVNADFTNALLQVQFVRIPPIT